MLEIRNVTKSYDEKAVLSSVCFTLLDGESLLLAGETGGGKTTLAGSSVEANARIRERCFWMESVFWAHIGKGAQRSWQISSTSSRIRTVP